MGYYTIHLSRLQQEMYVCCRYSKRAVVSFCSEYLDIRVYASSDQDSTAVIRGGHMFCAVQRKIWRPVSAFILRVNRGSGQTSEQGFDGFTVFCRKGTKSALHRPTNQHFHTAFATGSAKDHLPHRRAAVFVGAVAPASEVCI